MTGITDSTWNYLIAAIRQYFGACKLQVMSNVGLRWYIVLVLNKIFLRIFPDPTILHKGLINAIPVLILKIRKR